MRFPGDRDPVKERPFFSALAKQLVFMGNRPGVHTTSKTPLANDLNYNGVVNPGFNIFSDP